ncbi:MAG: flagellar motor switch protein FliN [Planctomycetota bacterium]
MSQDPSNDDLAQDLEALGDGALGDDGPTDEPPGGTQPDAKPDVDPNVAGVEEAIDELDALLSGASFEDPVTADAPASPKPAETVATPTPSKSGGDEASLNLPQFEKVLQEAQVSGIDLLKDVNLDVKIELGRCRMLVEDVLKLVEGSVVELDKLAGDPIDVYVNERIVARGEVLVLNDNFCVRVNEIIETPKEDDL